MFALRDLEATEQTHMPWRFGAVCMLDHCRYDFAGFLLLMYVVKEIVWYPADPVACRRQEHRPRIAGIVRLINQVQMLPACEFSD